MNVVPYIDVMLVLLVIFMVTAPMLQTGIKIDLPEVDANPLDISKEHEPLMLVVDPDGNYFLEDESQIELADMTTYVQNELMGEKANRPVYIRADQNVQNGYVVKAMAAVQKAGARNIGLMADIVPETEQ
jgi:biopolymer transport protein TolR